MPGRPVFPCAPRPGRLKSNYLQSPILVSNNKSDDKKNFPKVRREKLLGVDNRAAAASTLCVNIDEKMLDKLYSSFPNAFVS
jgi:hypothetical protein